MRELFTKMTGSQKLSVALFGGAVLVLMIAFLMRATSPSGEQTLFWNVSPSQAKEITSKLKDMNVDFRYTNGAIFVDPTVSKDEIFMNLAQDNLLPEDLSFDFNELLKQNGFTLTKDERDQRFGIALETELSKMISGIDDILEAKVRISREEPSPLLKRHLKRTASVTVRVRGKRRLTKDEATGIARLVASSVKGLTAENVTITDSKGRNYKYDDDVDAQEKWTMERNEERRTAEQIEDFLSEFIPKVKATVAMQLDLKKVRKEIKDYQHKDLNNGAYGALTNNFTEKENSNSKEGSQGVVGAGTNSSAEIKEGDGGTQMESGKSKKQEAFDNSLVQEFIEHDAGDKVIKSVSVVVVNKKINDKFDANLPISEENPEFIDHDWLAENPSLAELIAGVVGIDDVSLIKVTQQNMMVSMTPAPKTGWEKFKAGVDWTLVAMVVFALMGALMLLNMIKKAQPEEEILPMPEYEEEITEENLPPLKEPQLDPEFRQIQSRIKELIEEDPVKAAGLVRHWLSGD